MHYSQQQLAEVKGTLATVTLILEMTGRHTEQSAWYTKQLAKLKSEALALLDAGHPEEGAVARYERLSRRFSRELDRQMQEIDSFRT